MTRLDSATIYRKDVREFLHRLPQRRLCHLPTPLEPLPGLSKKLGVDLWVKRDDQTGLAFGGNKSRKLELVMGDAEAQGCDTVLTWAGVQSNWCRQAAAAARKCGKRAVLLLFKRPPLPEEFDGNYLIDDLLGASIHLRTLDPGRDMMSLDSIGELIDEIRAQEEAAGHSVYVAPIGASKMEGSMHRPLGALAFVQMLLELNDQAERLQGRVDHIVTATSSGSMLAGLVAGCAVAEADIRVTGISVSPEMTKPAELVASLAQETMEFLSSSASVKDKIVIHDQFAGPGYGLLDAFTLKAMRMAAELDGLLLDPVYTGKSMRGLIDLAKQGYFQRGERVVFLHTGGLPALFPYRDIIRTLTEQTL